MSTDINDPAAVERRLWDELDRGTTGMLGPVGQTVMHFQPMTAFAESDNGLIWFFTRKDTDLVKAIGDGLSAMYTVQKKDFQCCIGGELTTERDEARIDKYWNAMVAAWYPDGKADPNLILIRMACDDAQVWISDAGPVKMAFEVAKANLGKHMPDLGGRADIQLN